MLTSASKLAAVSELVAVGMGMGQPIPRP